MKVALFQPRLSRNHLRNVERIQFLVDRYRRPLKKADVCVLPECWFRSRSRSEYEQACREIQRRLGMVLIAGSHHEEASGRVYNRGIVLDSRGQIIARYGKNHPFDTEVKEGVRGLSQVCEFRIGRIQAAVLICADFFFSEIFHRFKNQPDVVFVPAESVSSSTNDPRYGRSLWQQMAIARAYEFTTFVAVSDWAVSRAARTCGVSCFVDPTVQDPHAFCQSIGEEGILIATCRRDRLLSHRRRRRSMSFFWR